MSEWWTYTLSDILLFTPRTYYRLFEIYNAAIWPAQVAAMGSGLAILVLLRRGGAGRSRAIAAILAACWLFVAIAFHARRYATINTAGSYFAWGFGIEAALWIAMGVPAGGLTIDMPRDLAGRAGLGIFLFALILEPLAAPLLGRGWKGLEIFGVAPDPTAIATLGLLLLTRARHRWLLMVIPILWCAITGAFLLAMHAPDAGLAPLVGVASIALTRLQRAGTSPAPTKNSSHHP